MKKVYKHILSLLSLVLLLISGGCGDTGIASPQKGGDESGGETYLTVSLTTIDRPQTRAGGYDEPSVLTGQEAIESLRIIIVDANNKVEVNRKYLSPDIDSFKESYLVGKSDKNIYAIVNEDYLSGSGLNFGWDEGETPATGISGIIENDAEFTFLRDKAVPMIGHRIVKAASLREGMRFDTEIILVRTAAKVDVTIKNNRTDAVSLQGLGFNMFASRQYLYPHFTRRGVISKSGRHPFIFNDTPGDFSVDEEIEWEEWLRRASEESQRAQNIDADYLADLRGWIMEYDVPENSGHSVCGWGYDTNPVRINPGVTVSLPTHYYAESKYDFYSSAQSGSPNEYVNGAGDKVNASRLIHEDAEGVQQGYTFDLTLDTYGSDGELRGNPRKFTEDLYNLRSFFRNTHVRIAITLENDDITLKVYTNDWNYREHHIIVF